MFLSIAFYERAYIRRHNKGLI